MALARYEGVVTDDAGNVVPLATIEMRRDQPGRPVVPLFADRSGTLPLGNPVQADANGAFGFHLPGGVYWVRAYTGPSQQPTFQVVKRYVAVGTAAERDIEDLAFALEAGTAGFATIEELQAFMPSATEGVTGKVQTGAAAGFYHFDETQPAGSKWVFDRPLYDSFARMTVSGGSADAIVAGVAPGISEAAVQLLMLVPTATNTRAVTLNGLPVKDINGQELLPGQLIGGRSYNLTNEITHYRLRQEPDYSGVPAAIRLTADEAIAARNTSVASRDVAISAKSNAEAARDASFVAGNVYADEFTGRSAVLDGVQFQNLSADGLRIEKRQRVSAGASNFIASMPTSRSKQDKIIGASAQRLSFSSYLQVGNIDPTTGLLAGTGFARRRSLVGLPVTAGASYRIFNLADTLSNLRVAWFNASNALIGATINYGPGAMADLTLVAPAGATTLNVTIKSGNTDSTDFDPAYLDLYASASGNFDVSKVSGFDLRDSRLDLTPFKAWLDFGITSAGGLNTTATESHTPLLSVQEGGLLLSTGGAMYRINYFNQAGVFIAQAAFTGGTSHVIPTGQGIAQVMVAANTPASGNPITVNVQQPKDALTIVREDMAVALAKQDTILGTGVSKLAFASYLQNGSVNSSTGLLDASGNRRTIMNFPLAAGTSYRLFNQEDLLSNLRIAYFNASGTLLSIAVVGPGAMASYTLAPPAGATTANIGIKSGNTDNVPWAGKVTMYASTSGSFNIQKINGFDVLSPALSDLATKAVTDVFVGGAAANKNAGVVTIDAASSARSGLMSKEDKTKLDSLTPGNLTISGSGIAKNASAFGFLPTNNADQNVAALQAAVLGGGLIIIDLPGVYNLNKSIYLDSNTWIVFGTKVYINKVNFNGKAPRYTFINRGAFTKEWNENIRLIGLHIICNGIGNGNDGTPGIPGLRGHVAFHYVRNLVIDYFTLLDGDEISYVIHICTFENIQTTNLVIEGYKDGVHLGNGKGFLIRNARFRTYDDPIALNAHDYSTGQPELGWVEEGLIENCWDLLDPVRGTTGYFARILAGAWGNWFAGMQVQQSDTVVASNGKMYRVFNSADGTVYTSNTEPSHASGTVQLDGINWTMVQETGVTYTVGVRKVRFNNIYLQKPRPVGLSIHFDTGIFSRSYYPNAPLPVQSDIVFENLYQQAEIPNLIRCVTPLRNLKIIGGTLLDTKIDLTALATAGLTYEPVNILTMGVTFAGTAAGKLVDTATGRTAKFKAIGSIKENPGYVPSFGAGVTVLASDI